MQKNMDTNKNLIDLMIVSLSSLSLGKMVFLPKTNADMMIAEAIAKIVWNKK